MVEIFDLVSGQFVGMYSCTPREAVVAAYAQFKGQDYNTWEYEEKYGHLREYARSGRCVFCGDYGALLKEEGK